MALKKEKAKAKQKIKFHNNKLKCDEKKKYENGEFNLLAKIKKIYSSVKRIYNKNAN